MDHTNRRRLFFGACLVLTLASGYTLQSHAVALQNISYNGTVVGEINPGFILDRNARVVITAESFGSLALPDPVLALRALSGAVIADNDNCARADIETLIDRPLTTALDACLVVDLGPGSYVANVRDRNGADGNVLFSVLETVVTTPPPPGRCSSDKSCAPGSVCNDGVCELLFCPAQFDPVCGVDGRTYPNACEARAAHVAVDHAGSCDAQGPMCRTDDNCAIGAICTDGRCEQAFCTAQFDPVCGADGRTYPNACEARAAHVTVVAGGACPPF